MHIEVSEIAERLSKSLKASVNLDTQEVKGLSTNTANIGEISKRMHRGMLVLYH